MDLHSCYPFLLHMQFIQFLQLNIQIIEEKESECKKMQKKI
jgi:hypothetical protein